MLAAVLLGVRVGMGKDNTAKTLGDGLERCDITGAVIDGDWLR